MRIEIKAVTANEITALADITRETFFDTFAKQNTPENMALYAQENLTLERVTKDDNSVGSTFYFALLNGEIAGYLKLNMGEAQTETKLDNALEIERFYVRREFQGQGLGKAMFTFALQQAQSLGCEWMWLGVWDQNQKAIEFYQRQGLQPFASHDFLLGNETQKDVLMRIKV